MSPKAQEGLPGIPQAPKRKVLDDIEQICLDDDKLGGKITRLSDERAALREKKQELLKEHKLTIYTYEDAKGVLQDIYADEVVRKRKNKDNPKKAKPESKAK